MNRSGREGVARALCAVAVAASLAGCIAPNVEVSGALGLTVDDQARPVLIVEACEGTAVLVDLAHDREGLAADEENEAVGEWTSAEPLPGTSELALHAPAAPWQGAGVEVAPDRGYIAGGQGREDGQVLTQVAFRGSDLADLDPDLVYRNDPAMFTDPDADPVASLLVASTRAQFTTEVCSRD